MLNNFIFVECLTIDVEGEDNRFRMPGDSLSISAGLLATSRYTAQSGGYAITNRH
jgi:hypothetical protein